MVMDSKGAEKMGEVEYKKYNHKGFKRQWDVFFILFALCWMEMVEGVDWVRGV